MKRKIASIAASAALATLTPQPASAVKSTLSVYGRIDNGIQYFDSKQGQATLGLRNVFSRLGLRARTALDNGLVALGHYEFLTFTNREGNLDSPNTTVGRGGINHTRIGFVGLGGDWGTVTVGQQWSSFYNTVGVHMDPTNTVGYFMYSSISGGPYRSSNTIKYVNSVGPVLTEVDLRTSMNANSGNPPGSSNFPQEEKIGRDSGRAIDGFGVGGIMKFPNDILITAAFDEEKKVSSVPSDRRWGVAGRIGFETWWASLGYMEFRSGEDSKVSQTQLWAGKTIGKTLLMAGYGRAKLRGTTSSPSQVTLGVYHDLGGGFLLYYEGAHVDDKGTGAAAFGALDLHLFAIRFDFST